MLTHTTLKTWLAILLFAATGFGQNYDPSGLRVSWLHNHTAIVGRGAAAIYDLTSSPIVAGVPTPGYDLSHSGNSATVGSSANPSLTGIKGNNGEAELWTFGTGSTTAFSPATGTGLTMLGAVNIPSGGVYSNFMGKGVNPTGYFFGLNTSNDLYISVNSGYYGTTTSYDTNSNDTFSGALTWTGSTYTGQLWKNGVAATMNVVSASSTLSSYTTAPFSVGANAYGSGTGYVDFPGRIFASAIWPYTLSAADISLESTYVEAWSKNVQNWLCPGAPTSGYTFAAFGNATYLSDQNLYIYCSPDGVAMSQVANTPYAGASLVRNPQPYKPSGGGIVYVAAQNCVTEPCSTFTISSNSNPYVSSNSWSSATITSSLSNPYDLWCCSGYWDGTNQTILMYYSPNTNEGIHQIYYYQTTNLGGVSGTITPTLLPLNASNDYIDAWLVYNPSAASPCNLFVKNDVTKEMEWWVSATSTGAPGCLPGSYSQSSANVKPGGTTDNIEAYTVWKLANGNWELIFYDVTTTQTYYCFSTNNFASWTTPVQMSPTRPSVHVALP